VTTIETLNTLLSQRYSCRAFLADPIDDAVIAQIVSTAQRVPSWCNAQPWQVNITRPDETERLRTALYEHAQSAPHTPDIAFPQRYEGTYRDRRRACGFALYDAVGIAKDDRDASRLQMLENFRFFGAPHVALITTEAELGPYSLLDCGAFVTAFTLAAEALGVASVPQAALAGFAPFLRAWFDLPDNRQIVCGISFGKSDAAHPANGFRTTRAPLDEVLTFKG